MIACSYVKAIINTPHLLFLHSNMPAIGRPPVVGLKAFRTACSDIIGNVTGRNAQPSARFTQRGSGFHQIFKERNSHSSTP